VLSGTDPADGATGTTRLNTRCVHRSRLARCAWDPPLAARGFLISRQLSTGTVGGEATVNHARITAEALRYRLNLVRTPLVSDEEWDLDQMAAQCVCACDPVVDGAIRRIATAWRRAGLDPTQLCHPWAGDEVDALFAAHPELIDALDELVRSATRSLAA